MRFGLDSPQTKSMNSWAGVPTYLFRSMRWGAWPYFANVQIDESSLESKKLTGEFGIRKLQTGRCEFTFEVSWIEGSSLEFKNVWTGVLESPGPNSKVVDWRVQVYFQTSTEWNVQKFMDWKILKSNTCELEGAILFLNLWIQGSF